MPIFQASCTLMSSLPPRFRYLHIIGQVFGTPLILQFGFYALKFLYGPHEGETGILNVDQVVKDGVRVDDVQLVLGGRTIQHLIQV